MTSLDLLMCVALTVIAVGLLGACAELERRGDVERRLTETHATVFIRIARSSLAFVGHVRRAATGDARPRAGREALLALGSIAILALSTALALHASEATALAHRPMPVWFGVIGWSALIEMPGQLHRHPQLSPTDIPLSPLTLMLVAFTLDATVSVVALSGAIHGHTVSALFIGALFVALPDAVSALLGVVDAASED